MAFLDNYSGTNSFKEAHEHSNKQLVKKKPNVSLTERKKFF